MTLNIITYKDNHDQFMGLHFKYWKVIMLIYRLKIWVIFCRPQCVNIMWHSGAIWQHGRNYCVKRNIVLRYYLLCQWYVRLCLLVGSRCGYPFGVGVGGEVGVVGVVGVGVRWGWWGWWWWWWWWWGGGGGDECHAMNSRRHASTMLPMLLLY